MTCPIVVVAYMSPYPIVVSETVAQYTASKNVLNVSGSTLNISNAVIRIYPTANTHTMYKASFCFLNTFSIIFIFFEYLNVLNTLNSLETRGIRTPDQNVNLSSVYAGFRVFASG